MSMLDKVSEIHLTDEQMSVFLGNAINLNLGLIFKKFEIYRKLKQWN